MPRPQQLVVRELGRQAYQPVWQAMQDYTAIRDENSPDELWLLEHEAVFTQGQAGKAEHLLNTGDIPVVQVDRGGQVTYHGPGQLVGYVLMDVRRAGTGVRELVTAIEEAIVDTLADYDLVSAPRADAPGVYRPDGAKIAQIGLRIRRGCSFHGLSLNVNMDLSVFQRINPCGHIGMAVTDIDKELGGVNAPGFSELGDKLSAALAAKLGFSAVKSLGQTPLPQYG